MSLKIVSYHSRISRSLDRFLLSLPSVQCGKVACWIATVAPGGEIAKQETRVAGDCNFRLVASIPASLFQGTAKLLHNRGTSNSILKGNRLLDDWFLNFSRRSSFNIASLRDHSSCGKTCPWRGWSHSKTNVCFRLLSYLKRETILNWIVKNRGSGYIRMWSLGDWVKIERHSDNHRYLQNLCLKKSLLNI